MFPVQIAKYHKIPLDQTVHHAIKACGDYIDDSSSPLHAANDIIKKLGGQYQESLVIAKLFAKSLIEQVYIHKDEYDRSVSVPVAYGKVANILQKNPYIRTDVPVDSGEKKPTDKKSAALAIYKQMVGTHSTKDIIKEIEKQLSITYANASYYVNRVFK